MQNPMNAIQELLNEIDSAGELLAHPETGGNLRVAREKLATTSRIARVFMRLFADDFDAAAHALTERQRSTEIMNRMYPGAKALNGTQPVEAAGGPVIPGARTFYNYL